MFSLCALVDYILIIRTDVDLEVNPNEVKAVQYFSLDELKAKFKNPGGKYRLCPYYAYVKNRPLTDICVFALIDWKFTPWFKLISENLLFTWWQNLDNLTQFKEVDMIHKLVS